MTEGRRVFHLADRPRAQEGAAIKKTSHIMVYKATNDCATIPQRFERKFFILPKYVNFAYAFLRHICRRDEEYPEGQVNSLYFDTPDLEQYVKSESGEFKKDKVRIRWYGKTEKLPKKTPTFLELKSRQGFASSKQRQQLVVSIRQLDPTLLNSGIIDKKTLIDTVTRFGHYPERPLRPIIMISYHRYRFNEMSTGMRVSLDLNIRSSVVTPELGYGERELKIKGGVIEVKGATLELPRTLRRIKILDTDWSRFSKYGICLDTHLSAPDTVARLWPSGRWVES
jgi:hypothetical protein